jgi:hypothetical protein
MLDKQRQRPSGRARSSVDNAVDRSLVRLRRQRDRRFQPNERAIRGLNRPPGAQSAMSLTSIRDVGLGRRSQPASP